MGEHSQGLPPELDAAKLPRHIAIIMDGNGRWAKLRGLPRVAGHRAGAESVRTVVRAAGEWGIEVLTLYAFSVENWSRPKAEVSALWKLLKRYLRQEVRELTENNVRLTAIGRLHELPADVQRELERARKITSGNSGLLLNLALNYGGRAELVDAINALVRSSAGVNGSHPPQVTEEMVSEHLFTHGLPDPDLLIRTSGERRISNFLLWQLAYTELCVTDTLWPDFRRPDLLKALIDYQQRERRFGGLGEPASPLAAPRPVSEKGSTVIPTRHPPVHSRVPGSHRAR